MEDCCGDCYDPQLMKHSSECITAHISNLVSHFFQHWLQLGLRCVQESVGLHVSSTERQNVDGRQACLLAWRHKHYHRLLQRMFQDRVVRRLRHCNDARCIVCYVESLQCQQFQYFKIQKTTRQSLQANVRDCCGRSLLAAKQQNQPQQQPNIINSNNHHHHHHHGMVF